MIALFYIAEVQHSRVANEKIRAAYSFAEPVSDRTCLLLQCRDVSRYVHYGGEFELLEALNGSQFVRGERP